MNAIWESEDTTSSSSERTSKKKRVGPSARSTFEESSPVRAARQLLQIRPDSTADRAVTQRMSAVGESSSNTRKRSISLVDQDKMGRLLGSLKSTKFVGKIDPVHHFKYFKSPDQKPATNRTGEFVQYRRPLGPSISFEDCILLMHISRRDQSHFRRAPTKYKSSSSPELYTRRV
jgi:hypothetical protein